MRSSNMGYFHCAGLRFLAPEAEALTRFPAWVESQGNWTACVGRRREEWADEPSESDWKRATPRREPRLVGFARRTEPCWLVRSSRQSCLFEPLGGSSQAEPATAAPFHR